MILTPKGTAFGVWGLRGGVGRAVVVLEKKCPFMFQSEMTVGV